MSALVPTGTHPTYCLARTLVRFAGAIHPARAHEWIADVAFLQSPVASESGLLEAWSHLASAPRLSCRSMVLRVLRGHPTSGAAAPEPVALSSAVLHSRRFLRPDFGDWVRELTGGATTRASIAGGVYSVGNCFAGDPQHVTFVRETDGSLRGLEMMGAEDLGVAVSAEHFERFRARLDATGQSITVLLGDELLALESLAERASVHFPGYGKNEEEVVAEIAFVSGAPL
jgi:hypothetical protein